MKRKAASFRITWLILLSVLLLLGFQLIAYWVRGNPEGYYDEGLFILTAGAFLWLFMMIRVRLLQPLQVLQEAARNIDEGQMKLELPTFVDASLQTVVEVLNHLCLRIQHAAEFVKAIENNNLEAAYPHPEGASEDDRLRLALLSLRSQLQTIANNEKERNWTTAGLATFGDILRANNQDLQTLSDSLMSNLVSYLSANQGGMFVVRQEEELVYLELTACYAYERKKYQQKRIAVGEGLVGQVYLERACIHLQDVPSQYVRITSGLGQATPRSLLIVPLIVNEVVYGVIEIASFNEFADYQIAFVQKLGESIASTLANVQANNDIRALLEETQGQTEHMRATEEEMRQNMEELQATQEQQERLQNELQENEALLQSKIIELEAAQRETAQVKELEVQRASEQIAKRNQMMVKVQEKFKKREQELVAQLQQQEEELNQLKNQ